MTGGTPDQDEVSLVIRPVGPDDPVLMLICYPASGSGWRGSHCGRLARSNERTSKAIKDHSPIIKPRTPLKRLRSKPLDQLIASIKSSALIQLLPAYTCIPQTLLLTKLDAPIDPHHLLRSSLIRIPLLSSSYRLSE